MSSFLIGVGTFGALVSAFFAIVFALPPISDADKDKIAGAILFFVLSAALIVATMVARSV